MPNVKIIGIQYTKGDSNVFSGFNKNAARKLEKTKNVSGGCGTYRVNEASTFEVLVSYEDMPKVIDIKKFLKDNLNIAKFTQKRLQILKDNLAGKTIEIEFKENNIQIPYDNEINKNLIENLKKLIWLHYFNSPKFRRVFFIIIITITIKQKNFQIWKFFVLLYST